MLIDQFRIVKYYHQGFNNWALRLEKLEHYQFLWWKWHRWEMVSDHPFIESAPLTWSDFNIVEEITDNKLKVC